MLKQEGRERLRGLRGVRPIRAVLGFHRTGKRSEQVRSGSAVSKYKTGTDRGVWYICAT